MTTTTTDRTPLHTRLGITEHHLDHHCTIAVAENLSHSPGVYTHIRYGFDAHSAILNQYKLPRRMSSIQEVATWLSLETGCLVLGQGDDPNWLIVDTSRPSPLISAA